MRLHAIIESAIDGIITFDDDGIIKSMNPAAEKIFGYASNEAIGKSIKMLSAQFYNKDYSELGASIKKELDAKTHRGKELKGRRKDGSHFYFRYSISKIHIKGRALYTGILHDLTEEKLAQQKMWQEKDRAQQYLNVANSIIVALDKVGRIQLLNNKALDVLGYSEEPLVSSDYIANPNSSTVDALLVNTTIVSPGATWPLDK